MSRQLDPIGLEDGRWVLRHGVHYWVADPPPPEPVTPPQPVVCDLCGATATEGCRTAMGSPRRPHAVRIGPRLCACGEPVEKPVTPYCGSECRTETRRLQWLAYSQTRRDREAS